VKETEGIKKKQHAISITCKVLPTHRSYTALARAAANCCPPSLLSCSANPPFSALPVDPKPSLPKPSLPRSRSDGNVYCSNQQASACVAVLGSVNVTVVQKARHPELAGRQHLKRSCFPSLENSSSRRRSSSSHVMISSEFGGFGGVGTDRFCALTGCTSTCGRVSSRDGGGDDG
jgi:hypothetical protein